MKYLIKYSNLKALLHGQNRKIVFSGLNNALTASEPTKPESKFCSSCRMILSVTTLSPKPSKRKTQKEDELGQIKQQVQEIFKILKETRIPANIQNLQKNCLSPV